MLYEKLLEEELIEKNDTNYYSEGDLYHCYKKEYDLWTEKLKNETDPRVIEQIKSLLKKYERILKGKIDTKSGHVEYTGPSRNIKFGAYSLSVIVKTTLYDRINENIKIALVGETKESLEAFNTRLWFGEVKSYELIRRYQIAIYKELINGKVYGSFKVNDLEIHWNLKGEINLHNPDTPIKLVDLPEDIRKKIAKEVATSKYSQGAFMINCENGGNYGRQIQQRS